MPKMTPVSEPSSPTWGHARRLARAQMQEFIQQLLEDEVDELLGRMKSSAVRPSTRCRARA